MSKARIHVERVIGRVMLFNILGIKDLRILRDTLPIALVRNKANCCHTSIVRVVCAIVNMNKAIV